MNEWTRQGRWPDQAPAAWNHGPASHGPLEGPPGRTHAAPASADGESRPGHIGAHAGPDDSGLAPAPGYRHADDAQAPAGPRYPDSGWPPLQYPARQPTRRRFPRWLTIAGAAILAVIAGVTLMLMLDSGPASGGPAAAQGVAGGSGISQGGAAGTDPAQPVITWAVAQHVLATYTAVGNRANQLRSDGLLAEIETGSSYAMDAGNYRFLRVSDPANRDYSPAEPADPVYYIPRQSAYPHWFAVKVTWTFPDSPKAAPTPGYVLFTQARASAPWKGAFEPYGVAGSGPAPTIATDAQGYAEQAPLAGDAAGLNIPPGQLASVTATTLDGDSAADVRVPGDLTDKKDQAFWHAHLPQGSTDTDTHRPVPGQVFALRTADGGALVLYSLTTRLTLAYPAGQPFSLYIPGYFSLTRTQTSATVGYVEQFAAVDPPPNGRTRIIAEYSGYVSGS